MVIGLLQIRISLPEARSLKDKRRVVRSLKDRIVHRMNVSAAEVGCQDVWQTAELAFVTVSAESACAQARLAELSALIRADPRYVLLDLQTTLR